ncbi:unnamed protein product, partial [Vitis vinifera]
MNRITNITKSIIELFSIGTSKEDPIGKSRLEFGFWRNSLYNCLKSDSFRRCDTAALSAALMLSSTKGTWAVWNWRYEASKEEMVANSDEINGSEKWVLMGLGNAGWSGLMTTTF